MTLGKLKAGLSGLLMRLCLLLVGASLHHYLSHNPNLLNLLITPKSTVLCQGLLIGSHIPNRVGSSRRSRRFSMRWGNGLGHSIALSRRMRHNRKGEVIKEMNWRRRRSKVHTMLMVYDDETMPRESDLREISSRPKFRYNQWSYNTYSFYDESALIIPISSPNSQTCCHENAHL